jgi:hypothetical protein
MALTTEIYDLTVLLATTEIEVLTWLTPSEGELGKICPRPLSWACR